MWMIFIFSFIVAWFQAKVNKKYKISIPIILMTISIVVGTMLIVSPKVSNALSRFGLARTYVLNENYNKKVTLFFRTFSEMVGLNGILALVLDSLAHRYH